MSKLSKGQREILEALASGKVLCWNVFSKTYYTDNPYSVISKSRIKTLADRGLIEISFGYEVTPAGLAAIGKGVASVQAEPEAAPVFSERATTDRIAKLGRLAVSIHNEPRTLRNQRILYWLRREVYRLKMQIFHHNPSAGRPHPADAPKGFKYVDHASAANMTVSDPDLAEQGFKFTGSAIVRQTNQGAIFNTIKDVMEPTPVDDDTALCPTCNGNGCEACNASGRVSYAFLAGYWQAVATSAQRALTAANQRVERLGTQIAQLNSREHYRAIEALAGALAIPIKSEADEMAASLLLAQSQLTTANERIAELEQNNRNLTDALESVSVCLADWRNNTAVAWSHREVIEAIEIINEALD